MRHTFMALAVRRLLTPFLARPGPFHIAKIRIGSVSSRANDSTNDASHQHFRAGFTYFSLQHGEQINTPHLGSISQKSTDLMLRHHLGASN